MIETALFSWKYPHQNISLWQSFLWCGSVNWAKRFFKETVLVSDDMGIDLLVNKLHLPFDLVIKLPDLPNDLVHLYDLPKLASSIIMAERNIPFIQVDYDAWLCKKLPDTILNSVFFCEFLYNTKPFVNVINSSLPVRRFDQIPSKSCATGIYGGNDLKNILNYSRESIRVATHSDNRSILRNVNGYQGSVLIGESAPGHAFEGKIETLLPRGNNFPEDYRKAGYIHVAGLKKNEGAMAKMAIRLQIDFPEEYLLTAKLFNTI